MTSILKSLLAQYFMHLSHTLRTRIRSQPVTSFVDESPFSVLPYSRTACLERLSFFKARLNDPFLALIHKAPFAARMLHGRQSFAV